MIKANDMRALADSKKQPTKLDHSILRVVEKNVQRAAEEGRYSVAVALPYTLEEDEKGLLAATFIAQGYTFQFTTEEGLIGLNLYRPAKTTVTLGWAA